MVEYKVLRRSRSDRMILGVCGGLADFFGLSTMGVRIVYILATAMTGFLPGIIVYLILLLLIPPENNHL